MEITFPSDTTDTIDAIRGAIGRGIYFYREYQVPCSACVIDPVTNTSTNSFCISCSGIGYIVTASSVVITGHITHAPSETMNWTAAGKYYEGDCRVQIKYTPDNITVVENTSYMMVDGKKFDVRKRTLRGVPEINRILIDAIERT